jgi:MinD superfamily P-loop ATPase
MFRASVVFPLGLIDFSPPLSNDSYIMRPERKKIVTVREVFQVSELSFERHAKCRECASLQEFVSTKFHNETFRKGKTVCSITYQQSSMFLSEPSPPRRLNMS